MFKKIIFSLFFLCLLPRTGFAVSLVDSMTVRPGFAMGDVDARSFDGPGLDIISAFIPFTDGAFYAFGNFDNADEVWQVVAEIADNSALDTLGVLNNANAYTAIIPGSAVPGDTGNFSVGGANNPFRLALQTPTATFDSIDALNADGGAAHVLGLKIVTGGNLLLPTGFLVSLLPGDIVVGGEDLPSSQWDYDYNDLTVVLRAVPEPGSMLLLASGLGLMGFRRKAKNN